jgi:hypothetical protein
MKARIQAGDQLLGLLTRAPEELRSRLWKLRGRHLVEAALRLEPAAGVPVSVTSATEVALWELAGRWHGLDGEIARLDELLDALVRKIAPDLLALPGVGTETAAALLEAAGDNPGRLASEAAFAHLCGAAPIPASSGRTVRHRFNPGGHREANEALWRIVLVRMKSHAPTRAYVARRTAEGLSKRRSCAASSATWPAKSTGTSSPRRACPPRSLAGPGHPGACRAFGPWRCRRRRQRGSDAPPADRGPGASGPCDPHVRSVRAPPGFSSAWFPPRSGPTTVPFARVEA